MSKKCPHCGNTDRETIEDNGAGAHSLDLTLLCLAPCEPEDCSFDAHAAPPEDRKVCGMQWDPNDDA